MLLLSDSIVSVCTAIEPFWNALHSHITAVAQKFMLKDCNYRSNGMSHSIRCIGCFQKIDSAPHTPHIYTLRTQAVGVLITEFLSPPVAVL
jgi:hypothetical protein